MGPDETLGFNIFSQVREDGFTKAGRAASAAADDVMALGRRLDEISKKSATARVGLAGDKDATAKLDKLDLKLLTTGRKVVDPTITLEGAAKAVVEISALDAQIDHLGRKSAEVSASGGGIGVFRTALTGVADIIGGGGGGGGGAAGAASGGAGLAAVLGAAIPIVTALGTVAIGAGTGVAAFGALAIPTFMKVSDGLTTIKADQLAVDQAVTKASKNTALAHMKQDWSNMSGPIAGAVKGIQEFGDDFGKMAAKLQGPALHLLAIGLQEAGKFLEPLAGIALAVTPYIDRLAKMIGTTLYKALMIIQPTIGPAFEAFLPLLGAISRLFLILLRDLADHMGTWVKLTDAITLLIIKSAPMITFLVNLTAKLADLTAWVIPHFIKGLHDFAFAFDELRHQVATVGHDIMYSFKLLADYAAWAWQQIAIHAVRAIAVTLDAATHIPVIGSKFKSAADAVHGELRRIEGDSKRTWAHVQGDINALHGKTVSVNVKLGPVPSGKLNTLATGTGPAGAPPGWALVGEEGPELAYFPHAGVQVIPNPETRKIMGYAGGTPDFAESLPGFGRIDAYIGTQFARVAKQLADALSQSLASSGSFSGSVPNGPLQQVARSMLQAWGWGAQWPQFNALVMAESGWNVHATNPTSGAYGIPQALPPGKMATAGLDWRDNGVTQLRWEMGYIRDRWKDPAGAWANEQAFHWYDQGGWLPPGISIAANGTGAPERVGGGGATYNITINTLKADRDVGRHIVTALKEFEKGSGKGWRS
jgi:hypothetical protein